MDSIRLELARAAVLHGRRGAVTLYERDAALLAWLAVQGPTARAALATLLWPDSPLQDARNTLRQRLFQLKKLAGAPVVLGDGTLALAPDVAHDLAQADALLGAEPHDYSAELAAWLARERARRAAAGHDALRTQITALEARGDYAAALALAQDLLAREPLSEAAHRRVIRLHYLDGDRAAALVAFDRCEQVLKDEVGTRPSAETLALLATVTAAQAPLSVPAGAMPASVLLPPRLVGRDAEWAALRAHWERREVVLLDSEPGMGKSRLLRDLAQRAGSGAVRVAARPGDDAVPFALLARLLRQLLAGGAEVAERHRPALQTLLPELGTAPASAPAPLALHEAIDALVAAASAAGAAGVTIDDLQYADAASAEALQPVLGAASTLAWVLAFRSGALPPATQALVAVARDRAGAHALTLAPLDAAAIAQFVDSLQLPGFVGANVAPRLLRHTGGNPLYLLETLKQCLLLAPEARGSGAALRLPTAANVVALIGQRLAQLSPAALRLARCAAVAGQDFGITLAEQVLGTTALELADAWAELERAQVLRDDAFAHDLIREAALASLPAVLARRLHGQVAQSLAAGAGAPQRIAAHWLASETPRAAVPFLLTAAQQAARALRAEEALQASLQAADLLEAHGEREAALQALVALLMYFPLDARSDLVLARLATLARSAHERALIADRHAEILARRGDFVAGARVALEALEPLDRAAHPALAARLLVVVAGGEVVAGATERAIERMHQATDLAARSGDPEAEATTAAAFAAVLDHAHRYAEAYLAHRRAYDLAMRPGVTAFDQLSVVVNLAGNRALMGQFATTRALCEQCYRIAGDAAIDLPAQWPALRGHHADALAKLGEYTQAIRMFEDARGDLERYMPAFLPGLENAAAMMWIHLGQWARAHQAVQAALRHAGDGLPRYRQRALLLQGEIATLAGQPRQVQRLDDHDAAVLRGDGVNANNRALLPFATLPPDEALARAQQLRADAGARQIPSLMLEADVRCAQSALRAGHAELAAQHARAALDRLREDTLPAVLYRGEVWVAAAAALAGPAPEERVAVLRHAAAWITSTARERVPAEFRDSFLQRNPANRALLEQAARL